MRTNAPDRDNSFAEVDDASRAMADHLLDFGPEGGDGGGEIVAVGTPEQVADNPASWTGRYLKEVLDRHEQRRVARVSELSAAAPVKSPRTRARKTAAA